MIPPVVASDRGRAQTGSVATRRRGCWTARLHVRGEQKHLERCIPEGDNPVCEALKQHSEFQSNAEHEEFCAKPPGPSGKAKYSHETDSERVL